MGQGLRPSQPAAVSYLHAGAAPGRSQVWRGYLRSEAVGAIQVLSLTAATQAATEAMSAVV